MGLAGRKEKQRIPNDPRNLSWADDANKFGAAYLQKLGWSAGTGLGTAGEGRTSHIKVHQKLDMLGIGAAHQKDPNGLAWKQNRDFENLLRRLNAANGEADADEEVSKIDGFAKAKEGAETEMKESKKKRKRSGDEEVNQEAREEVPEEDRQEKRKRKKEKKEKKAKKAKEESEDESQSTKSETQPEIVPPRPSIGRPVRAHRARFMASKHIASKSSAAIDEILGISRSGTSTPYPTISIPDTPDEPSSSTTPSSEDGLKLQELTTSSKSVMDYFKEKLLAKSNAGSSNSSTVASTSVPTPHEAEYDDYDDRPRGGLGLGLGAGSSRAGLGASRLREEVEFEEESNETGRAGLGTFSRTSTMFSAAKSVSGPSEIVTESIEVKVIEEKVVADTADTEKEKNKRKKDKGKRREEAKVEVEEDREVVKTKEKRNKDKKPKEPAEEGVEVESEAVGGKKKKRRHREDYGGQDDEANELKPAKEKKYKKERRDKVDIEETASTNDKKARKEKKNKKSRP